MAKNDREIIARLMHIFQLLRENTELTIDEMLFHMREEASARTLQRVMKALTEDKRCPIEKRRLTGRTYAYYITEANRRNLPVNALQPEEALIGKVVIQGMKAFRNTGLEDILESFEAKFSALLPDGSFKDVNRQMVELEAGFETFQMGQYDYREQSDVIMGLLKALLKHDECIIVYSGKGVRERRIRPFKMIQYKGGLYVYAGYPDDPDVRLFAVHRILSLQPTGTPFELTDEIKAKLEEREKRPIGIFDNADLKPKTVVLKFDKDIAHQITGRQWHSTQKLETLKDGSLKLTMKVALTDELYGWIFWWQGYVKVLKPTELVEVVRERIRMLADRYS